MTTINEQDRDWLARATRKVMDRYNITNGDFVVTALRDAILYARRTTGVVTVEARPPSKDDLAMRLRGSIDEAEYIISGERKTDPLKIEAAERIERDARYSEVGAAFYKLTVQQRDNAWREVETLRAELDKLSRMVRP
jgi:hypothetical protein